MEVVWYKEEKENEEWSKVEVKVTLEVVWYKEEKENEEWSKVEVKVEVGNEE